ncbi:MAG: hypothetical protein IRY91_05605 [Gemmatimonadaceae bacterium]|nr:hypothetical protein [Gemmatimonadaceae bacterium]
MRLPASRTLQLLAAVSLLLGSLALSAGAAAQSLRGSHRAVSRPYRYAKTHDLTFLRTSSAVRRALHEGDFVRLGANPHYVLHEVSFPYVTPTTRLFVRRLAAQYHNACGERLVITSAVRPKVAQPANASPRSVHPTGIAIDLRRPTGKCLRWLRSTLLTLERRGVVEATEEHHPAHFHVVVYGAPYRQYLASR